MKSKRRKLIAFVAIITAAPFTATAVIGRVLRPQLRAHLLERLNAAAPDTALGSEVRISLGGRVTIGPVDMEWPSGSLLRHLQIRELTVSPVLASFISGSPRLAAIRAKGVIVELETDTDRDHVRHGNSGDTRDALLAQLAPLLRDPLKLAATDVYVRVLLGKKSSDGDMPRVDEVELNLATLEANTTCRAACTGDAHVVFSTGGELTLGVQSETNLAAVPVVGDQVIQASINLIGVPPATLPPVLTTHLDRNVGRVDASITADLRFMSSRLVGLDAQLGASGEGLTIDTPQIDPAPVSIAAASTGATIRYRQKDGRIAIDNAFVGLGDDTRIRLRFDSTIDVAAPHAIALHARAIGVPFQALIEALPEALRPGSADPQPRGDLDAWADIAGPLNDPSQWQLAGDVDVKTAHGAKPTGAEGLRDAFVHHVVDDFGITHDIMVGPDNESFVPLTRLPEHVVRAVTTAEDGGFFGHHGFDVLEIKNSIAAVTSKGRSVRGGSTLTQQLAKNLYLTSAKTYSRKVREALIALALEGSLSKQRLLEIYVNIIEWGPGLYGIGPASERYFGKAPDELSAKEAAYLASIIPNPVRYYGYYARGEVSETFEERVNDILEKLHATGVLDDDAYAHAVVQPVMFAGR